MCLRDEAYAMLLPVTIHLPQSVPESGKCLTEDVMSDITLHTFHHKIKAFLF